MCSLTGDGFSHSIFDVLLGRKIDFCELANASQIIQANNVTDKNEIRDPNDDTIFQEVNASG